MNRRIWIFGMATVVAAFAPAATAAQAPIPDSMQARTLPRQHLSGPRFGFTAFTGDVAELRRAAGKQPVMSQFGWQFETQIVSTTSGNQALPNVSVRKEAVDDPTTSMVIAMGATMPFGELYVPANVAMAFAEGGPRITALLGWIIG